MAHSLHPSYCSSRLYLGSMDERFPDLAANDISGDIPQLALAHQKYFILRLKLFSWQFHPHLFLFSLSPHHVCAERFLTIFSINRTLLFVRVMNSFHTLLFEILNLDFMNLILIFHRVSCHCEWFYFCTHDAVLFPFILQLHTKLIYLVLVGFCRPHFLNCSRFLSRSFEKI